MIGFGLGYIIFGLIDVVVLFMFNMIIIVVSVSCVCLDGMVYDCDFFIML